FQDSLTHSNMSNSLPSKKCKEDENEEKECVNEGPVDESNLLRIQVNLESPDEDLRHDKTVSGFPWTLRHTFDWTSKDDHRDSLHVFLDAVFL
ncbi:hypothetical protein PFISCL1PPCAC_20271, partial [Pristionchus fissidentatus]